MRTSDTRTDMTRAATRMALMPVTAVAAILFLGCSPELPTTDGYYGCADGGTCPPGYTCRLDQRCHAGEELGRPAGESCDMDTDCLVGLACIAGHGGGVANLAEVGYCGTTCTDEDPPCAEGTTCFVDECVPLCETTDTCPEDSRCRLPELPRAGDESTVQLPGAICADTPDMNYEGNVACTMESRTCAPPGFCLVAEDGETGLCSMRCAGNDDHCPRMAACMMVDRAMGVDAWGQCFLRCATDGECGEEMTCELAHTGGPQLCMPTAWAGMLRGLTFLTPSD